MGPAFEDGGRRIREWLSHDLPTHVSGTSWTRLAVDPAGRVFVSAFVVETAGELFGGNEAMGRGSVILAFDADGTLRWARSMATASDLASVVGILADGEGGVDGLLRTYADDGLDTHSLIHLDERGELSERAAFTAAPMGNRAGPCHLGAYGCYVSVEFLERMAGGGLLLFGHLGGVELSSGSSRVRSQPTGNPASGFWASFDSEGRLRWLRETRNVLTTIVMADGDRVMATVHPPSHEEVTRTIATEGGRTSAWSEEQAESDSPISTAIRLHRVQRRLLAAATLSPPGRPEEVRPLRREPVEAQITPAQLAELSRLVPHGPGTQLVQVGEGSFARFVTLRGRLEVGDQAVESSHRMVGCHPGPVGEERSIPPGCLERLDRPSAVLMYWPLAP